MLELGPAQGSLKNCYERLSDTHHFVYKHLDEELIWRSMPCVEGRISIPIAYYGESNIGKMKTIYREGLKNRYGSLMEIISEFILTLVFPMTFGLPLKSLSFSGQWVKGDLKTFLSYSYFGLIRNVQKWGWVIPIFWSFSRFVWKLLENFKEIPHI